MIGLIKIERKKYSFSNVTWKYFFYSFLVTIVTIIIEKNSYRTAALIAATMMFIDFNNRYNKEKNMRVLKNSLITPMGRKKVIKAKIIVSTINGLGYLTISMGITIMKFLQQPMALDYISIGIYSIIAIISGITIIFFNLAEQWEGKFWISLFSIWILIALFCDFNSLSSYIIFGFYVILDVYPVFKGGFLNLVNEFDLE